MASTAEIQSQFSPHNPLEPDILSELRSIIHLHDLSAEDLFFKWESYCIKLDLDAQTLSLSAIRALKQHIQDDLEKSQRQTTTKSERKIGATPRTISKSGAGGADVFGMLEGLVPNTPTPNGVKGGIGGNAGLKRKHDRVKQPASSPSASMTEQMKSMNGLG